VGSQEIKALGFWRNRAKNNSLINPAFQSFRFTPLLPIAPSALSEKQMEITGYVFDATHVALASLVFILVLIPVGKLLRRTGHHPVWCILALFPGLNLIAFWFFAFKPWPTDKKSANTGN
jgi:hypothetical protein